MRSVGQIISQTRYNELLQSDEWKDFSRSIRRARGNVCQCCRLGDKPTQTHHIFYDGRKPWEYDPEDVVLLCDTCHKEIEMELRRFRRSVFRRLDPKSFRILNDALEKALNTYDPLVFAHSMAEFAGNQRLVQNHAKAWGLRLDGKPLAA